MEKFKWSSITIVLIGVLLRVEQLPFASVVLMTGLILCSGYCIHRAIKA